jgi:SAM-dependent methyltransferase
LGDSSSTDRDQLTKGYTRLLADEYSDRWSLKNPGNRESLEERMKVMTRLVDGRLPARALRILDLGCGSLTVLPSPVAVEVVVGLDLLFARLRDLRDEGDATPTVLADGAFLPFPAEVFDAVVMSTMLSSVLAETARVAVCAEVTRVLSPAGAVLWYDFRLPSPGNTATRPIRRRELRRFFPSLTGPVVSLTVAPPLARHLGKAHRLYPILARLPFLRTHLAACLVK